MGREIKFPIVSTQVPQTSWQRQWITQSFMQPFRSSPLFPTKKAFRKREMAPRPQRAGFGQWMDAGPPKSMASMGKAVMSPRMHFQGSALLPPALSPPRRPMPCFIFLCFLSLAVSLWILWGHFIFSKFRAQTPAKAHDNTTAMATLGLLHFSFGLESRKYLKGRARVKPGRKPACPLGGGVGHERTAQGGRKCAGAFGREICNPLHTKLKKKKSVLLMDM